MARTPCARVGRELALGADVPGGSVMSGASTDVNIGRQLREARERRGLSQHDVSDRTKIKPTILDAIERGDFAQLPGEPFRRGYLRAYAHEVGLDPETIAPHEEITPIALVSGPGPRPDSRPTGRGV